MSKPVRIQTISMFDPTGLESTDNPKLDIEAAVRIANMEDENLNNDIKIEVLHGQGLKTHQSQLDTWRKAHGIEHRPGV
jgi:hypothetical protein